MSAEGFRIADAFVRVDADAEGLRDKVEAKVKAASAGLAATVTVSADAEGLAATVRAEAAAAGAGESIVIPVSVDTGESVEKLAALDAAAHAARDSGNGLTQDSAGRWRNALGQFATDAEKAAAGVEDLGRSADGAGTKTKGAGDKAGEAGKSAAGAGGGFLGLSGTMWALVGAASAVGPALAALPGLLAGGGLAALTMGAAFSGVAGALRDHVAVTNAVGASGAQLAATTASNAIAIRDSKAQIVDARRAEAQQAQDSAETIANAERSVVDAQRQAGLAAQASAAQISSATEAETAAVRQAAISQQNSLDSIASAEERLGNAQLSQADAQRAVNTATADATNQLVDLKLAATDANLNAEDAALRLTVAQQNLDAVNGSSLSNPIQRRQAAIDLAKAQAAVADANQKSVEATQAADKATKEGASGLPSVVSAQEAYTRSVQSTADAQHAVQVAQRNAADQQTASAKQISDAQRAVAAAQQAAADQQVASAESVAKAQQGLADAQRDADRQKVASTEAVAKAVQALADTQQQQGLAAAAAGSSGSAAADKYAKDMKGLTDQGRTFVAEVLSWRDALHELSATGQAATLPGFTGMLEGAKSLLPVVNTGVHDMGGELSDTAAAFGHLFSNPQFDASAREFTSIITGGFGQFASALPPLLNAIVTDGVKAGPLVNAVAVGVHDLVASGLPAFLSGLTVNAGGAAQGVGALFRGVDDLLGPVGMLVGAFGGALGPALAVLEPDLKALATDVETDLLPLMPQLSTDLLDVANVVDELFKVVEPLVPVIASDLASGLRIVDPLLRDTATFLHDNADWLTPVAEGVLGLVVAVKAWHVATGLADDVTKAWKKSMELFGSEGKVATGATKAWNAATSDLAGTLGTVVPIVGGIVGGSLALGQWLGSVGDHARDADAEVNRFTGSIIDLSRNAPNAGDELDFLARTAVGFNKSIGGGSALLVDVDTSLANLVSSGHADQAAAAMDGMAKSVQASGGSVDDLRKLLPKYGDALGAAANDTKQAASDAQKAQSPFQGLALRLVDTGQAGKNTADDLSHVDTALTNLDKQLGKQQALDDYNKALGAMKDGAAGASKSIDGNSQSAMDNRRQLEDAVTAARHFYDAQIAAGVHVDDANAKFQNQVDLLRTQAEKTYGSKKAVDDFLMSLGLIKPDYTTTLKVNDVEGRAVISAFQKTLNGLSVLDIGLVIDKIVGVNGGAISIIGTNVKARAGGGPVFAGDTVLVGEEGPEVIKMGGDGNVIPNHQIHQVSTSRPPTAPASTVNINYYGTQRPTAEQRALMYRDFATAVRS